MTNEDTMRAILARTTNELTRATDDINRNPPPTHNQEDSGERFVILSDKLGDAMLEAARSQLTLAENHYRECEKFVEDLRHDIKRKWEEYQALVRKLEDFSVEILEAHKKFHNGMNR